ncbi:MAG: phage tail protein [Caldilineaceae bacterium]
MAETYEFRLQQLEGSEPKRIVLRQGRNTIGRQPGSDLLLDNDRVSRTHAEIICGSTQCRIIDLDSANGTKVNGEKLAPNTPMLLPPGAEIEVAEEKLRFERHLVGVTPSPGTPAPPPPAAPPGAPPWEPRQPATGPKSPYTPPPGLSRYSAQLLQYLPEIYRPTASGWEIDEVASADGPDNFMARFLGIFESILAPVEWNIDNFDLFLHANTAPVDFLGWLASWFNVTFDSTWDETQRRTFLREAHTLYARRGTRAALSRVLEIYTGSTPEIIEFSDEKRPFWFQVRLAKKHEPRRKLIEALIDAHKPVNTSYDLDFT